MSEAVAIARKGLGTSRRWLAATVLVAIVGVCAYLFWRATSIQSLPDIGDPFDREKHKTIPLAVDANAFTFYRRAHDQLRDKEPQTMKGIYRDWSEVSPGELAYVDSNREAMATWLEGTNRDRGLYLPPGTVDAGTPTPILMTLRSFCRMVNLQALRLEHVGDFAGAWAWYRANLRASRHLGQDGHMADRIVGISLFDVASKQAIGWSVDPKVDARLLRRALEDVLALDALTPPNSDAIRNEYFWVMNTLDDPEMRERFVSKPYSTDKVPTSRTMKERLAAHVAVLYHEPERSRRVSRLLISNWLAACDLPAAERARRIVPSGDLLLYEPLPGEISPLATSEIARWYRSTRYARSFFADLARLDRIFARDETNRATLIVHIATQLYKRETGDEPAHPRDLVGKYLNALPVGFEPPLDDSKAGGAPK
jgi:hypothetical protein